MFLAVLVLAGLYIVPGGKMVYQQDFSKKHFNFLGGRGFFYKMGPEERLADNNKMIGDPLYFYVRAPRSFSEAIMTIKYKISSDSLVKNDYLNIETGILMDKSNWRYNLYPVFNNKLNKIFSTWSVVKDENMTLAQKNKKFSRLTDFIEHNDFSKSAFYNYNLNYDYVLPGYQAEIGKTLNISNLQGSYSFYTYIKDENLKVDFSFLNKNNNNTQALSIFVYYQNNLIFDKSLTANIFSPDLPVNFNLNLSNLPEGVYKVEIKANDDFLTSNLISYNSKLVFINRVWLSDLSNGLILWSDKNNFKIKSFSAQCLDKVDINNEIFTVDKIYQQFDFTVSNKADLYKITSDSCGLLIENNGLFSFTKESFFNPGLNKVAEDTNWDNIDTVVADYSQPLESDGYYISKIKMNLQSAVYDTDGYRFIISAPFLKNLSSDEYVEIKEIKIEFQGKTLMEKIKEIVGRFKK